jgi:hypothetical protein
VAGVAAETFSLDRVLFVPAPTLRRTSWNRFDVGEAQQRLSQYMIGSL